MAAPLTVAAAEPDGTVVWDIGDGREPCSSLLNDRQDILGA